MIRVEDSVVIRRPVGEVFAYVSDLTNGPEWQANLVEVRRTTDGPLGVGTRFTFVRRFLGRRLEAGNVFTAYAPDALVRFSTTSGPMAVEASYAFEPTPEGTRVTCRLEMRPGRFARLAEPLIAAGVRREMAAEFRVLTARLERPPP